MSNTTTDMTPSPRRKKWKPTPSTAEYHSIIGTRKWQGIRAQVLAAHPYCALCRRLGIVTPATEVHHLRPVQWWTTHEELLQLAYDLDNLLPICHHHHTAEHMRLRRLNGWRPKKERIRNRNKRNKH